MEYLKANGSLFFACAVLLLTGYFFLFAPPADFPSGSIVVIAQGSSAPQVAKELSDAHVIAHPTLLWLILRASGKSSVIQTGAYRFEAPQNLFTIAHRIVAGDFGMPLTRITFVEGITLHEAAAQVAEAFPAISPADFITAVGSSEGYLFPDTYFFPPIVDAASIVKTMRANFDAKIAPLLSDVQASGHSLSAAVIMASLIQKEARTDTDQHLVAGILWNRITIGMPLQVDAAPDTYKHTGFPPSPICDPGSDALDAAVHPTPTKYLYYLTGRDGLMHYATTYAEHQANLRKYLD